MKTTLNSAYPSIQNPKGIYIGTRGKGGQGGKPWPKVRAQPRPYGRVSMAVLGLRVQRFEPRVVAFVPCQLDVPVSSFGPLVLTNQLSKVNGYIIGL